MMPFIGVRISWLMVARKSDFAWFAASAASRASRRSRVRSATVTLEVASVRLKPRVAFPDVAEHGVEAIDQLADLAVARGVERDIVVVLLAHLRGRGEEPLQRLRDAALKPNAHSEPNRAPSARRRP